MKAGTIILLAATSTAGSWLASYLLRDRPDALRWAATGLSFAAPWAIYGMTAMLAKPTCSFLFIADTHGPAADNAALVTALLKERRVSFVAHGGDVADADEPSLWRAWWDEPFAQVVARWPVHAAAGNHDISTSLGASRFVQRFGILPKAVTCGNVEIFFLPWDVNTADLDWLRRRVLASQARWRVLVTHQPIWTVYGNGAGLFAAFGPAMSKMHLVLAGHGHVFQDSKHDRTQQVIEVSGPKKYDCPPEAEGCVAGQTGYLRIDAYADELKVTRRVVW